MTYTIWHSGIKIGESDFDHPSPNGHPQQRAGTFWPTAYGHDLFPRLTGIMTASADLYDELEARGLKPDQLGADEITRFLDEVPAGRKIVDIGRALGEIEIRDARGQALRFKQIAFIDLEEIRTLSRRIGAGEDNLESVPANTEALIVSATLRNGFSWRHRPVLPA